MSRILIVEDEKSMRDLLELMLRKQGYTVTTVDSAVAAKGLLESDAVFDLVVSDVSMPGGLSGLDLLRETRRLAPETAVVIMTAYGTKQTAIEALNDGASYYVEKPFDIDEMKVVIGKTLKQRQLLTENVGLREQTSPTRNRLRPSSGCHPAVSFSKRCIWLQLVSWNSSTSTCRMRRSR